MRSLTIELDKNDQLSLWIGRIARAHAGLETPLRLVWVTLLLPVPGAVDLYPKTFSSQIDACKTLCGSIELPDSWRAAVDQLFKDLKVANEERNRAVHDIWVKDDRDSQFVGLEGSKRGSKQVARRTVKRRLDHFRAIHDRLRHLAYRCNVLSIELGHFMPGDGHRPGNGYYGIGLAVLLGNFEIDAGGEIVITSNN